MLLKSKMQTITYTERENGMTMDYIFHILRGREGVVQEFWKVGSDV